MLTSINNKQNFGAKYSGSALIKMLNKGTATYSTRTVSVLEFDSASRKDLEALVKLADKWGSAKFSSDIASTANRLHFSSGNNSQEKIYILTTQNSNYNMIDVKQVLGLAETSCGDNYAVYVNFLQTKPSLINKPNKSRKPKEFTHIGEGMLNLLKKKNANRPVYLYPLPDVVQFYERNGFKKISESPLKMKWTAEG